MEQTLMLDKAPRTDAEYEAATNFLLAETARLREQMAEDQREIERLRAETRAILASFKAS